MPTKRLGIDAKIFQNPESVTEDQKLALKELGGRLSKIKMLALDFDGTLTDGKVFINGFGTEYVTCSRKDGQGIALLKKAGVYVCVITSEVNDVVLTRCQKLGIPFRRGAKGAEEKLKALQDMAAAKDIKQDEVAVMGDDVNDLLMLDWGAVAFTVADCHDKVRKIADYITSKNGGDHAVREAADLILMAREASANNAN